MSGFTESEVEEVALGWLGDLGCQALCGPEIAAGEATAERKDPGFRDVVLEDRLRGALARLNAGLPPEALEDAFRKLTRVDAPSLVERNRAVHRMLVDAVTVEYRCKDGSIVGAQARVIDFDVAKSNDPTSSSPVPTSRHAPQPEAPQTTCARLDAMRDSPTRGRDPTTARGCTEAARRFASEKH